jgi:2,3-bisphosphoglycerate-dependent phosphoglycerate mutase
MRITSYLALGLLFLVLFGGNALSQSKKTIILVRHAEKDVSATADPDDPNLSTEGLQRAERLAKRIKRYRPGAIYSTNYLRALDTASPTAKRRNLKVQIYDAKKTNDLIDQIMKSTTKRFLIVGHSNTLPALANLLIKKDLFKSLDDSEYGTIWVIRIRPGSEPRTEILQY